MFIRGLIRYHRGLGKMPWQWKPWLTLLLVGNMIVPLFYLGQIEAQVVLGAAILNGAIFSWLTGLTGFSRLLGLGHLPWIPLIVFLWMRLDAPHPPDLFYGYWLRGLIVVNAGSLILDTANVIRYVRGEREEMVEGL